MKKKVLFVASVERHLMAFHIPYLKLLKENGCEVHTAARGENEISFVDVHHEISFTRSPFSIHTLSSYFQLKRLLRTERYDAIHCHTPNASFITRLAAKCCRKTGTTVIYTAHGFHFFKGAPKLMAWIYRTIEKYLSKYTDCIIIINEEDYLSALKFKCSKVVQSAGMGVDPEKFYKANEEEKIKLRRELHIPKDAFVLIYPAEMIARKNHVMLLKAVELLKERIPSLLLLLPGEGKIREELEAHIKARGLGKQICILGYRNDVDKYMKASDIDVAPSCQEGKSIHVLEALCCGVPVVGTAIRGHEIIDGHNGFFIPLHDAEKMAERIYEIYSNKGLAKALSENAVQSSRIFHIENTVDEFKKLYCELGIIKRGADEE